MSKWYSLIFKDPICCEKYLKDDKHNSLYLTLKILTSHILTVREGCTGDIKLGVMTVQTACSTVPTKRTEGWFSPVQLEKARLVSNMLNVTTFLICWYSKTKKEAYKWSICQNPDQPRGVPGTLGISGWGCAAGTLKPLAFTRASSGWILLPYTRVNSPNPPIYRHCWGRFA